MIEIHKKEGEHSISFYAYQIIGMDITQYIGMIPFAKLPEEISIIPDRRVFDIHG